MLDTVNLRTAFYIFSATRSLLSQLFITFAFRFLQQITFMQHNDNPVFADGSLLFERDFNVIYECRFLEPIHPSEHQFKRDFMVEHKRSFVISGIDFHSWKSDLYMDLNNHGESFYNGISLDLKPEPWNEHDENAIAIYMLGRKLGYIRRHDTEDVDNIMLFSKHYTVCFKHVCFGYEMCEITYLREFHDTGTMPYQADLILKSLFINADYDEYAEFINACVGHTIKFEASFLIDDEGSPTDDNEFFSDDEALCLTDEEVFLNNYIALETDTQSTIGFINDVFINRQYRKTPMTGFIEKVHADKKNEQVEINMRLFMNKSVINKNYLKSFKTLEIFFGSFYDAGTYSISLADLIRVLPRKSRSLSAYMPLVKYLKEYHAITLLIAE